MPGIMSQLSLLTDSQTQGAIYFVIGIIVIEGVWLTYLTYMMWKRHRQQKEVSVEAKAESEDTPKQD